MRCDTLRRCGIEEIAPGRSDATTQVAKTALFATANARRGIEKIACDFFQ